MFRPAGRALLRHSPLRPSFAHPAFTNTVRPLSTAAPKKSSFKSAVVRWALAGGIAYWYATSNIFADEPKYSNEPNTDDDDGYDDRPTSILLKHTLRPTRQVLSADNTTRAKNHGHPKDESTDKPTDESTGESTGEPYESVTGPGELEEEAGQQGAFNPETGEINWDCPCLGGMADGPCGEQFKTAFSCFVFSKEDPKGVDCIDKFKGMQTCFQQHPEIYGSELDGDEGDAGDESDESDESPANRTEGSSDSTDIDKTETPTSTTINPIDSSLNQADAPIETVAGKSHSSESTVHPDLAASAKQGTPTSSAVTTKSNPIADIAKEDKLVGKEVPPHSKPEPERKENDRT